jgi:metal-sulfur cluster biosynthetic enzyme
VGEDLLTSVKRGLEQVIDPCSAAHGRPLNLWEMGLVRDLEVTDGVVTLHLYLTSPACTMLGKFYEMAEAALLPIPGVERVVIVPDTGLDWPGMPGRGPRFTGLGGRAAQPQRRGTNGLQ